MSETPDEEELPELKLITQDSDPCVVIGDGNVIVFDVQELREATNSHAAMLIGPDFFVLKRDSFEWVNVTSLGKKAGKVSSIRKQGA